MPVAKICRAPELPRTFARIGRHFGLYDKAIFQDGNHRPALARSRVRVAGDDKSRRPDPRALSVPAGGLLHQRAKLPGLPGIASFRGHSFHTSRWDYAYTGGTSDGRADGAEGQGRRHHRHGATAMQCVPHLGAGAATLRLPAHAPSSVDFATTIRPTRLWAKSLKPGWQKERMENFSAVVSGEPF